LAVAWSEHAFETAFLSAGADCPATGLVVGVCCATVTLEPIRTTNAHNIRVLENLICGLPEYGRIAATDTRNLATVALFEGV
jgi:hypothetical protein